MFPDLNFELHDAPVGNGSITTCYQGAGGPVAEVFHFGADGKVIRTYA
jgi:hypothetical protein